MITDPCSVYADSTYEQYLDKARTDPWLAMVVHQSMAEIVRNRPQVSFRYQGQHGWWL